MSSHIHGYNETLRDWERITSESKKLHVKDTDALAKLEEIATNTSTSGSSTIIQGLTDIADPATNTNLLTDTDGHLQVDVGNFPTTQAVSGSVSVSNHPSSIEVSNFPTTQAVSGSVSVSNQITDFSTETTLSQLDAKISTGSGNVGSGSHIQQILVYGKDDSGNQKVPINIDSNGNLNVVSSKETPIDAVGTNTSLITQMTANSKEGTNNNDLFTLTCNRENNNVSLHTQSARYSDSDSNTSVADGSYFDSVNVGQAKNYNAFLLTSNSTGSLFGSMTLEGSNDNTNWIQVYDIYEMSHGGSTVAIFEVSNITYGFQYYRIKNNTGGTINLTNGQYNYFN